MQHILIKSIYLFKNSDNIDIFEQIVAFYQNILHPIPSKTTVIVIRHLLNDPPPPCVILCHLLRDPPASLVDDVIYEQPH